MKHQTHINCTSLFKESSLGKTGWCEEFCRIKDTKDPGQLDAVCNPGLYAGSGNSHTDRVINKIIVKVEDIWIWTELE